MEALASEKHSFMCKQLLVYLVNAVRSVSKGPDRASSSKDAPIYTSRPLLTELAAYKIESAFTARPKYVSSGTLSSNSRKTTPRCPRFPECLVHFQNWILVFHPSRLEIRRNLEQSTRLEGQCLISCSFSRFLCSWNKIAEKPFLNPFWEELRQHFRGNTGLTQKRL